MQYRAPEAIGLLISIENVAEMIACHTYLDGKRLPAVPSDGISFIFREETGRTSLAVESAADVHNAVDVAVLCSVDNDPAACYSTAEICCLRSMA